MKKITFKNEPSVETPLSAENLNLMQANVEEEINRVDAVVKEEINRVDAVDKRLSTLETNRIDVEAYVDDTTKTITADKWGSYNNTFKKALSTKKMTENDKGMSRRFKVLENGLYKISFEAHYSYNSVSGIQIHLNNDMIRRILTSDREGNMTHCMFLNLKKDDLFDIFTYTDAAELFSHKFTSVIFEKIGEYVPPVQS